MAGVVEVLVEVVVLEAVIMEEDMVILGGAVVVICPIVITKTSHQGRIGYGLVVPQEATDLGFACYFLHSCSDRNKN